MPKILATKTYSEIYNDPLSLKDLRDLIEKTKDYADDAGVSIEIDEDRTKQIVIKIMTEVE